MSHSKRNTSLAFFTSHERSALRQTWGSQSARLNRDSFLPFGSCTLCLQPAVDPVGCAGGPIPASTTAPSTDTNNATTSTNGTRKRKWEEYSQTQGVGKRETHLFCRACAIASLLSQKKEFKRLERDREARGVEEAEMAMLREEEARVRRVQDFERVQVGLGVRGGGAGVGREDDRGDGHGGGRGERLRITANGEDTSKRNGTTKNDDMGDEKKQDEENEDGGGKKRKLNFDDSDILRVAESDQRKAHKSLDEDAAAEARAKYLPSFWVPALTPSSKAENTMKVDGMAEDLAPRQPLCPGSTPETAHGMSLKGVVAVRFTEEGSGTARGVNSDGAGGTAVGGRTRICPSCSRPLTNASRSVLAKPCGHVVCGSCVEQFVLDEGGRADERGKVGRVRCFVCSEDLTPKAGKEGKKAKGERGLILISSEGTGFAGGGKNVVKKQGTAFQC